MRARWAAALLLLVPSACGEPPADDTLRVIGGDPHRGREIVTSGRYGCTTCHAIPGIRGARGIVGPTLDRFARQSLIAGQLPNTPGTLVRFLLDPPRLIERTAMPDVGLSVDEARDVAAFLYAEGRGNGG